MPDVCFYVFIFIFCNLCTIYVINKNNIFKSSCSRGTNDLHQTDDDDEDDECKQDSVSLTTSIDFTKCSV